VTWAGPPHIKVWREKHSAEENAARDENRLQTGCAALQEGRYDEDRQGSERSKDPVDLMLAPISHSHTSVGEKPKR
jgi:hypothetical protein